DRLGSRVAGQRKTSSFLDSKVTTVPPVVLFQSEGINLAELPMPFIYLKRDSLNPAIPIVMNRLISPPKSSLSVQRINKTRQYYLQVQNEWLLLSLSLLLELLWVRYLQYRAISNVFARFAINTMCF